jgi:hypothetical protein
MPRGRDGSNDRAEDAGPDSAGAGADPPPDPPHPASPIAAAAGARRLQAAAAFPIEATAIIGEF